MFEMIFVENVYFSGLAFLQCDWKMHLQHVQMHDFEMLVLLQLEFEMWSSGSELHAACARWFKHVARQKLRERAHQVQWQVA